MNIWKELQTVFITKKILHYKPQRKRKYWKTKNVDKSKETNGDGLGLILEVDFLMYHNGRLNFKLGLMYLLIDMNFSNPLHFHNL